MKPIVFLDMDGVLADLDGGMYDLYRTHVNQMDKSSFYDTFLPDYVEKNMFENQHVLIHAQNLVYCLDAHVKMGLINLAILTSTGHFYRPISEVRNQKSKFIEKHFPTLIDVPMCTTTSGRHKCYLAHTNSFLIDDHPENIETFIAAGGGGHLYDSMNDNIVKETLLALDDYFGFRL